jgi:hypothetical protein
MQRICTFLVPAEFVREAGLGGDHDRSPAVQQAAYQALVRQTERFFPNLSPSSTISGYGIGPSSVSLRPCGADERIADLIFAHSHGAREKRHPKQASWCRRSEDATSRLERRRITAWNGAGLHQRCNEFLHRGLRSFCSSIAEWAYRPGQDRRYAKRSNPKKFAAADADESCRIGVPRSIERSTSIAHSSASSRRMKVFATYSRFLLT